MVEKSTWDLENRSIEELRQEAKRYGIPGCDAMNKPDLIKALRQHNK